ncbi:hypothetical protein FJY63_12080 [Candidatus Sumerlaeota bacterium]|nr:hypothetical protein [Candidatus Sumerlaeota bacterium]
MDRLKMDARRDRISLAAEMAMRHDINPLHAAISIRSWAETERYANTIRDRLQRAIFTSEADSITEKLSQVDVITEADGSRWVRYEDLDFLSI